MRPRDSPRAGRALQLCLARMNDVGGETKIAGLRDEYVIESKVLEGGFGLVRRATRASDGAAVVIKELRVERLSDWKSLELFEREGTTLRSLSHPRIPAFCEIFAWDGERAFPPSAINEADAAERPIRLMLVQRHVDGTSLAAAMREGRRFTNAEVEQVLRGVLEILRYLHELHPPVVHRDIHPGNIIIDDESRPFLIDFGAVQDGLRIALGSTMLIGTAGYMALEHTLGRAGPKSDLYALAMTMLAAISRVEPGAMPIDERTSKIDVRSLAPHLEPRVARALEAMVEPLVARRVASAAEALEILDGRAGGNKKLIFGAALAVTMTAAAAFVASSRPTPTVAEAMPTATTPAPKEPTASDYYISDLGVTDDIDGDGVRDLIGSDHNDHVFALSGKTGVVRWSTSGSVFDVGPKLIVSVPRKGWEAYGADPRTGQRTWTTRLSDDLSTVTFAEECVVLRTKDGQALELGLDGARRSCERALDAAAGRAVYRPKDKPLELEGFTFMFSAEGAGTTRLGVARMAPKNKPLWSITLDDASSEQPRDRGVAIVPAGVLVTTLDRERHGYRAFLLDPETGATKKQARICSYVNVSMPKIHRLATGIVAIHCESEVVVVDDSTLEPLWAGGRGA